MPGRCCVKRGSIAFAKSQLTMIGLLFASGASSSSNSPSSSHGNHATKWHLVTRLLGLPLKRLPDRDGGGSFDEGLRAISTKSLEEQWQTLGYSGGSERDASVRSDHRL